MLTAQVMERFSIIQDWSLAGYYETSRLKQLQDDIRVALLSGKLISVTGPIGTGKTTMINRLRKEIKTDKKIIVARSLSVERNRVTLPSLLTALFLDVSGKLDFKIPGPENRERVLLELICKRKKPVVLFIDEAHYLHGNTLNGLKRLMEILNEEPAVFSIVLVGHPRLQNNLKRPTMEEIGNRTIKFDFSGIGDERPQFLDWLLEQCLTKETKLDQVISEDAREFMAEHLATPLQFSEHLNRSFINAFRVGEPTVTKEIVEEIISPGFQDLDARLARMGYTPKDLAVQFETSLPIMRAFLKSKLGPERTDELASEMRNAGLPV
ncbi:AAA family ATPase [Kiloniella sp.]|uniref:AAA family ATPase n=1 Tax=Kiloniella sp. TaxID=1938587 RepID=UPI003B023D56